MLKTGLGRLSLNYNELNNGKCNSNSELSIPQ